MAIRCPQGAITRIGTVRFRQSNIIDGIAFSADGERITSVALKDDSVWDALSGRPRSCLPFPWLNIMVLPGFLWVK